MCAHKAEIHSIVVNTAAFARVLGDVCMLHFNTLTRQSAVTVVLNYQTEPLLFILLLDFLLPCTFTLLFYRRIQKKSVEYLNTLEGINDSTLNYIALYTIVKI